MWCNKLLFMSFVASSFLVITSAAPLQKREAPPHSHSDNAGVKDVEKISLYDKIFREQIDYDDYFVPSIDLVHQENLHPTGSESESKGDKGFKTICDNSGGGSKCADDDSIEELLRKIKAISDGKKELKESELKTLNELFDKLTKKVHELQQKCGGDENNRRKRLTEKLEIKKDDDSIDELLRKIKAVADGKKELKESELKTINELVDKLTKKVHELQQKCGDDYNRRKRLTAKIIMKETIETDDKPIRTQQISRTFQVPPPPRPPAFPPPAPTINYAQALPADVNYNGGMNKPIDVLKVLYPHGHWPDEDYANRAIPIQPLEPSAMDYYNDYNQVGHEANHREPDDFDFHDTPKDKESSLTPEYLESIIRNERMFSPSGNQRRHHVQEH